MSVGVRRFAAGASGVPGRGASCPPVRSSTVANQRKLEGSWQGVPLVDRIDGIPGRWAVELIKLDVAQVGRTREEVGKGTLLRLHKRRSPLFMRTRA